MKISLLRSGFTCESYADSLIVQGRKDVFHIVYPWTNDNVLKFAQDYNIEEHTADMETAIQHHHTDVVLSAPPNYLHEDAAIACAKADKDIPRTNPLGVNTCVDLLLLPMTRN